MSVECETDERSLDDVEADTRVLMAKHKAIAARGFDSIRERDVLHRRIDALYDEYALRQAIAEVTR